MQAGRSVASAGVSFHLQRKASLLLSHPDASAAAREHSQMDVPRCGRWDGDGLTCRTELVATTFHTGSSGGRVKPGPTGLPHEGQVRPQSQGLREQAETCTQASPRGRLPGLPGGLG